MAPMVFERRGALLIPREDIVPLAPEEAAERQREVKAQVHQKTMDRRAYMLLCHLDDNPQANVNLLRGVLGIRYNALKESLMYCADNGYVDEEAGPNRSKMYSVSKTGRKWMKENPQKPIKKED